MRTLRSFTILAAAALFLPNMVAADSFTYDLGVANTDITFSKGTLVAGDTIRIYGRVTNWGTKDISGYMTFYQGEQLVGNSQVVTVRPNVSYDDVWVDFVVPKGSFNIRGEIKGTTPQDENPANDVALSPMFTPLTDADGDLIADTQDNCKDISNADQKDADADGKGDVCDPYPNDATNTPPAPVVVTPPASTNTTSESAVTNSPASLSPAAEKPTVTTPPKSAAKPAAASVPSTTTEEALTTAAENTPAIGADGSVEGASTTLPISPERTGDAIGVS
nr:thrombospondin type 3 repeat-containing protein [Patescibacteria group bacterium]